MNLSLFAQEFEVGKTVLYEGREYVIAEIFGYRKIRLEIKPENYVGEMLLKEYLKKNSDDISLCIAKWFIAQKKITHGHLKSVRDARAEKQKYHIERMIQIDKLLPTDVTDILNFALTDPFWQRNLLTINSLRDRSANKLMKWENIKNSLEKKYRRTQDAESKQ